MSSPRKISETIFDRLEQVATFKSRTPSYKELHRETGLSEAYLKNVISRFVRLKRANVIVSRETIRKSLMNESDFKDLIEPTSKSI